MSERALIAAAERDEIAINPIIYAEISAGFVAGRAFVEYRRQGGVRTTPLPDFYIGAHVAVGGLKLLTRDARRYTTYFPKLALIAPS
jgi:predicted nucleic acid-binding protein